MSVPTPKLKALLALGLTKNQAIIYVSALAHGLVTASELARLTHINRQQVYADTEKLMELGLLDMTKKKQRKFIAAPASALITLAERRQRQATETAQLMHEQLPFFESLRPAHASHAQIKYFEGLTRIREAYLQELATCHDTEVLSFAGSVDDLYDFFPEAFWEKWNAKFVAQNNRSRMLVHDSASAHETAKLDAMYHRETRHLASFPLQVNIDVWQDTVLIVSAHDELAMWMESPIVAESYRILFQTCWKQAETY